MSGCSCSSCIRTVCGVSDPGGGLGGLREGGEPLENVGRDLLGQPGRAELVAARRARHAHQPVRVGRWADPGEHVPRVADLAREVLAVGVERLGRVDRPLLAILQALYMAILGAAPGGDKGGGDKGGGKPGGGGDKPSGGGEPKSVKASASSGSVDIPVPDGPIPKEDKKAK